MADRTLPTVNLPTFPQLFIPANVATNPQVQTTRPLVPMQTPTTPTVPRPVTNQPGTPIVPRPIVTQPVTPQVATTQGTRVAFLDEPDINTQMNQGTIGAFDINRYINQAGVRRGETNTLMTGRPMTPVVPRPNVPETVEPRGVRVVMLESPNADDLIDVGRMRQFTGGDTIGPFGTRQLTPQVPRPITTQPITPTVPKPVTTQPITPQVPRPTMNQPLTPTVPRPITTQPMTQQVPRPITMTTQPVPRPTVTQPMTPPVPRPTIATQLGIPIRVAPLTNVIGVPRPPTRLNVPQAMMFSPETIDEDTIIQYANTLDQVNFGGLLKFLGDYYHNDESLVSDETYDELVDIYEAKYGAYEVVGAEPTGDKVKLPYYLGSLRKIKKDQELTKWLEGHEGPYIIEDKIDGLTLLLVSTIELGRRVTKLYTRGGGYRGLDVSHLLTYMRLPAINEDMAIRGEVVMTREAFKRVGGGYKNARNLVSGIVGAKKQFNPTLARELSFYAYRIMNKGMSAEEDINELRERGFLVPTPVAAQTLTKEILENYFNIRKEQAPYEVDGLVIYQNRAGEYPEGEAPRHVVAFKTGTETGVTTVTNVIWRASKDRLLKPVVHYETINLSGADLQRASGYNARFIVDNNIGPGARILLTRSGDVIPKILSIIAPAPGGPGLPDANVHGTYDWNENGVEFVVYDDNPQVIAGRLKHFLNTLGVKNAGMKRVEAMVAAGIRSITSLLGVTPNQLAGIPGIGPTLSNQFYQDIHERITNVSLARIMDASGIFPHIGERSFEAIVEVYPNLLDFADLDTDEIARYIRGVKGFDTKADDIAENLSNFALWIRNHPMITIEQPQQPITTPFLIMNTPFPTMTTPTTPFPTLNNPFTLPQTQLNIIRPAQQTQLNIVRPTQAPIQARGRNLSGMTFVFSGFRDKDLEDRIRRSGGKVTTAVSRNTTMLIMKDVGDVKGKAQEAQTKGVQLISREDFVNQYLD